jgi:predicted nuclease of restriction endonuclease-like RecB superfamily
VLSGSRLPVTVADGEVLPTWLTERDHPWLRVLLEEVAALADVPMDRVEAELGERLIRRVGTSRPKCVAAAQATVLSMCDSRIDAPAPPPDIRQELFLRAATVPRSAREELVAQLATSLGTSPDALRRCLFADRPGARLLTLPERPISEVDCRRPGRPRRSTAPRCSWRGS